MATGSATTTCPSIDPPCTFWRGAVRSNVVGGGPDEQADANVVRAARVSSLTSGIERAAVAGTPPDRGSADRERIRKA